VKNNSSLALFKYEKHVCYDFVTDCTTSLLHLAVTERRPTFRTR